MAGPACIFWANLTPFSLCQQAEITPPRAARAPTSAAHRTSRVPPRPGPAGAFKRLSVSHSKTGLYGVFVWARRALNSLKRRFLARAAVRAAPRPAPTARRPLEVGEQGGAAILRGHRLRSILMMSHHDMSAYFPQYDLGVPHTMIQIRAGEPHRHHRTRERRQVGPKSSANTSLLWLFSHRNARANLHILGQPNTFLAPKASRPLEATAHRRAGALAAAATAPRRAPAPPTRCARQALSMSTDAEVAVYQHLHTASSYRGRRRFASASRCVLVVRPRPRPRPIGWRGLRRGGELRRGGQGVVTSLVDRMEAVWWF